MNHSPFIKIAAPRNPLSCILLIPVLLFLFLVFLPVIVIYVILLMIAGKNLPFRGIRPQTQQSRETEDDVIDVDVIHSETESSSTESSRESSGRNRLE